MLACSAVASVFVVMATAASPGAAEDGASVYAPLHRSAEDLLPLATAALGDGGTAVVDAGKLVLLGPPTALERAREVLALRDVPRPVVTLDLETHSARSLRARGRGIRWGASTGSLRTGLLDLKDGADPPARGARTLGTGRDEGSRYSVQVLDGESAQLELGSLETWTNRTRFVFYRSFLEVTSGFRASPRVLENGDVLLTLEWHEGEVESRERVDLARMSTTVRVARDETVVLGTLSRRGATGASLRRRTSSFSPVLDEQVVLLRVSVR